MNSDMSMRTIGFFSIKKEFRASALHSSVLPTPVGPRNRKDPFGRRGSASPARERRMALATMRHRLLLAHHAFGERLLHAQQLFLLALEHLGHRNAGPLGDHLGDLFLGDLVAHQLRVACFSAACASASFVSRATGIAAVLQFEPPCRDPHARRAVSISSFSFSSSSLSAAPPCSVAFSAFQISSRSGVLPSPARPGFPRARPGASSWPRPSPSSEPSARSSAG